MAARGSTVAQGFSQRLLLEMYERSVLDEIVNRDYQGEINGVGSKLNILNFNRLSEKNYTGSPLSADDLTENNTQLIIDQKKSFYWKEKTIDNWISYIKNPHATIVKQKADERLKNMDIYAFGFYGDVAAGNRVGTDYTTGTVSIDAAGNVTGTGTTFTSAMVGKGFKAAGHTKWYRVKTYTSATSIAIEDDLDDVPSQYTGGVISSGSTYTIEAVSPVTITASNLLQKIAALKLKLDNAEKNGFSAVPDTDRWLLVPPEFETLLVQATGVALNVPAAYEELVKKGYMTQLLGFKVFKTSRLSGNNTTGYHCLAGHPAWLTFAEKLLEADIEEELIGDFGSAYKDLFVYGGKVADERRGFAAEGFFTFSV
jgi:hypothetical protein